MAFNWRCPFCGTHTTILGDRRSDSVHVISMVTTLGRQALHTLAIACPNPECNELYLTASMGPYTDRPRGGHEWGEAIESWQLRPLASVKSFPGYVPAPILQDYREACLIRDLSPKASATLSRRCLQGMIRDFWGIAKPKLVQEIEALKDKVDPSTWAAIDAVRQIGNIGAHMEKDIDVIVDVDPDEAGQLIGLVETLIEDWYIARHERERRMSRLVQVAAEKQAAKKGPTEPSQVLPPAPPMAPAPMATAPKVLVTPPVSPDDDKT